MNEQEPMYSSRVKVAAFLGGLVGAGIAYALTKDAVSDYSELAMVSIFGGLFGSIIFGVGATMVESPEQQHEQSKLEQQ